MFYVELLIVDMFDCLGLVKVFFVGVQGGFGVFGVSDVFGENNDFVNFIIFIVLWKYGLV